MQQILKMRYCARLFLVVAIFFCAGTFAARHARADSACVNLYCVDYICCTPVGVQQILNLAITTELQVWLLQFYNTTMEPKLKDMAGELTGVITIQARMIGGFFDAQAHSTAMLSLQKLSAEAVADYMPSEAICRFGSLTKALAASDSLGRRTRLGFAERAQNRQMLNKNMNSAESSAARRLPGRTADQNGRLQQYNSKFCSTADSDGALGLICDSNLTTAALDAIDSRQLNRDIDYTRTFDMPMTLDLNFAGGGAAATRDQTNLFALGDNLYGSDIILNRPEPDNLDVQNKNEAVIAYQDFKTAIAKRSVVENSFGAIAALKTPGTDASTAYMRALMTQLGMSTTDIDRFIGTTNPSYYAQMEILSRKLYQDPGFIVELMDKPANVMRQQAAMKAISLMQERDIYDSLQRSEMLFSTLLEVYAIRQQKENFNKTTRAN